MRKRINKILWHGDELLEEKAKAPGIATSADGLDGLNEGEIYISNNEKDPALFIRTSSGKVVRVGVNYEELKKLFLSKTDDDTAEGVITFNKGMKLPAGEQTVWYKDLDISSIEIITKGVGIFADSTDAEQFGEMVSTDADMVSTDFIDLQKANYIDISLLAAKDEASRMGLVFYNAENVPVKGYYISGQEEDGYVSRKIAVPEGATQIRFSAWSITDETLYLKLGYFADTVNTSLISSLIKADEVETAEFSENSLLTAAAFGKLFTLKKDDKGNFYIHTPYSFASDKTVSSLGVGKEGEGEVSAISALYKLVDVLRDGENDRVSGAEDGNVLMFDAATGKWYGKKVDIPKVDFTEVSREIDGLQRQLNTLISGDASDAIDTFNEVVAFLKDIEDTDTLKGILSGKQNKIDANNKLDYSLLANTPSLADFMGGSAIGGTASSDNFSAVYWDGTQWQTRTIYKWSLASVKPSYTTSEVTEGNNLYFTDSRAKDALKKTTDDLSARIAKFEKMFQWGDGDGSYVKTPFPFASDKTVSSLGIGSDGGSGVSYNRLDSWENYDADAGAVLSATLGYELKQAIENIDLGDFDLTDYLTKEEAGKTYATIASLSGYQPLITDLATIRANAVLGKEAHAWGDHKKGGYALAASLATVSTTGSYSDLKNVPTKLSDFTDDVVSGKYQPLISATNKLTYSLISGTPTKLSDFEDDIVKGKYQPLIDENNRLAYSLLDDAPTSLKNPNALKFGDKSYDGSEEKTITAKDLGALTEHQTIYALTIKDDAGKAQLTYTPNVKAGEITLTKAMVGLGLVENTALSTWTGTTKITTLGTVTSGTWKATKIANDYIANPHVTIAGNKVNLGGSLSVETLQTSLDIVTLSTEQTITGKKTFTKQAVFYNGIQIGNDEDGVFLWWDGEALRVNKPFASDSTVSSLGVGEDGEISGDVIDLTNVVSNIIPSLGNSYTIGDENTLWKAVYATELYTGNIAVGSAIASLQSTLGTTTSNIQGLTNSLSGVISRVGNIENTYATKGDLDGYAQKATTLAGYGITDAYTKTEADNAISNGSVRYATSAGSADKLSTARTIWGQFFDGSGDITKTSIGTMRYLYFSSSDGSYNTGYVGRGGTGNNIELITYGAYNLDLGTNGGINMRINQHGNVTIGSSDLATTNYKFYVEGNSKVSGTLDVGSTTTLGDKLTIRSGGMSVTGTAYFGGGTSYYFGSTGNVSANTLTAAGATSLKSTLAVTGATTLSSTLGVSGVATFNSNIKAKGYIYFGANNDAYIYWDSDKNVLRTNVSFASDKTVSSLGVGTDEGGGGSADWNAVPTSIIPTVNGEYNLGDNSKMWNTLYVQQGFIGSIISTSSYVTISSAVSGNGNTWQIGSNGAASFSSLIIGGNAAATQAFVTSQGYMKFTDVTGLIEEYAQDNINGKYLLVSGGTLYNVNSELPLHIKGGSTGAYIGFKLSNNTDIGYIGVNDTKDLIFGFNKVLHSGNTSFSAALTTGTKIGTINIGGTTTDLYAPVVGGDTSGLQSQIDELGRNLSNLTTSYNDLNSIVEDIDKNKLFAKVDKVNGKGLSTNDFTAAYKTSLDNLTSATGLASGYIKKLKADTFDLGGSVVATTDDLDAFGNTIDNLFARKATTLAGYGITDGISTSNIGSQSVASANKLSTARTIWGQSFDGSENVNGSIRNCDFVRSTDTSTDGYYIGLSSQGAEPYEGLLLFTYGSTPITMYTRSSERLRILSNGNVLIGTTTDSGQKLQVNGDIRVSDYITFGDHPYGENYGYGRIGSFDRPYSVSVQIGGYGKTFDSDNHCFRVINSVWNKDLFHVTDEGNVGIGVTSPNYKLHVEGDSYVNGSLTLKNNSNLLFFNSSAEVLGTLALTSTNDLVMGWGTAGKSYDTYIDGYNVRLRYGTSHTTGIWLKSTGDVSLEYGALTLTHGNIGSSYWSITNDGAATVRTLSQTSDITKKNVLSDIRLSLGEMANAPLIKFTWVDGLDSRLHVGTIAQYWDACLPEVVSTTTNGILALGYGELGVAMGISLATHLTETNDEVSKLKKRVEELENENKRLQERVDAFVA